MLEAITTKIYADGADPQGILLLNEDPLVSGFTTNPTLMRKAGVLDYETFARGLLESVRAKPISFEVFADELADIEREARHIASWGSNVYVKVPVTTTSGISTAPVIRELTQSDVQVNVTAVFTPQQVHAVTEALADGAPSVVSVFAGRIADAGVDPIPLMMECRDILGVVPTAELLWASPRQVLDLVHADSAGCHIITMTHALISRIGALGKDLTEFSLETVQMFHGDARDAGYSLNLLEETRR